MILDGFRVLFGCWLVQVTFASDVTRNKGLTLSEQVEIIDEVTGAMSSNPLDPRALFRRGCDKMTNTINDLNKAADGLNNFLENMPEEITSWHETAVDFMQQQIKDFSETAEGKAQMKGKAYKQMIKDVKSGDTVKKFDTLYKYIQDTYGEDPLFPKRDLRSQGGGKAADMRNGFMADVAKGLKSLKDWEKRGTYVMNDLGSSADILLGNAEGSVPEGTAERMIRTWYRQNWRAQYRFETIENAQKLIDSYQDGNGPGAQEGIPAEQNLKDLIDKIVDDKGQGDNADDKSESDSSSFAELIAKLESEIDLRTEDNKLIFALKKVARASGKGKILLLFGILTGAAVIALAALGFTGNLKKRTLLTRSANDTTSQDTGDDLPAPPYNGTGNSTGLSEADTDKLASVMGPLISKVFEATGGFATLDQEFDVVLLGLAILANSSIPTLSAIVNAGMNNTATVGT